MPEPAFMDPAPSRRPPIFIVGAPRSGTTLLRLILDSHPSICCPPWETGVFDRLAPMLQGDFSKPRGEESNFASLDRGELISWMRCCVDDLMSRQTRFSGKPRWGEKTPAHVFHMALIHEVFPQAKFLHIVRDGRAVVRSLQNVHWSPRRIRWSVNRWIDSVTAGRAQGRELGAERYLEVRYEDLTRQPEETVIRLCEFLQEPFARQMLEFYKPENNSWGIAERPIQPESVNDYPNLGPIQRIIFSSKAGRLLRELGYA